MKVITTRVSKEDGQAIQNRLSEEAKRRQVAMKGMLQETGLALWRRWLAGDAPVRDQFPGATEEEIGLLRNWLKFLRDKPDDYIVQMIREYPNVPRRKAMR